MPAPSTPSCQTATVTQPVRRMMCTPLSVKTGWLSSPTASEKVASSNGFCIWPRLQGFGPPWQRQSKSQHGQCLETKRPAPGTWSVRGQLQVACGLHHVQGACAGHREQPSPKPSQVAAAARAAAVALRGCQLGKGGGHVSAGRDLLPAHRADKRGSKQRWAGTRAGLRESRRTAPHPALAPTPETSTRQSPWSSAHHSLSIYDTGIALMACPGAVHQHCPPGALPETGLLWNFPPPRQPAPPPLPT